MQPDYPANLREEMTQKNEVNQNAKVNQSEEINQREEVKMENDSPTFHWVCKLLHTCKILYFHSFSCGCSRIVIIHCCEECSEDLNTYKDILKNKVAVKVICSSGFFT